MRTLIQRLQARLLCSQPEFIQSWMIDIVTLKLFLEDAEERLPTQEHLDTVKTLQKAMGDPVTA